MLGVMLNNPGAALLITKDWASGFLSDNRQATLVQGVRKQAGC